MFDIQEKGKSMETTFISCAKSGLKLILCLSLLSSCSYFLSYKEHAMKKQFEQNFHIFLELVSMHKQDESFSVIDPEWTQIDLPPTAKSDLEGLNVGLDASRWIEYNQLFKQAGIGRGLRRHYSVKRNEPRSLLFLTGGMSSFGFAYKEKEPARVFKSFQACRDIAFDDKYRCYVFLRTNWYMYVGVNNEPVAIEPTNSLKKVKG